MDQNTRVPRYISQKVNQKTRKGKWDRKNQKINNSVEESQSSKSYISKDKRINKQAKIIEGGNMNNDRKKSKALCEHIIKLT